MSILSLDMPTTSQRSPRSLSSLPAHETLAGECQQTRRNLTFSNPDFSWHGFSSSFLLSFKVVFLSNSLFFRQSFFLQDHYFSVKLVVFLSNSSLSSKLVYFVFNSSFFFWMRQKYYAIPDGHCARSLYGDTI